LENAINLLFTKKKIHPLSLILFMIQSPFLFNNQEKSLEVNLMLMLIRNLLATAISLTILIIAIQTMIAG